MEETREVREKMGIMVHYNVKVRCVVAFGRYVGIYIQPLLVLEARHAPDRVALPFALGFLGWKCLSRHWVGYPIVCEV